MQSNVGKPINNADEDCPFNGKPVKDACHRCPMWVRVRGKDPQSEEIMDHWLCSFAVMPMLTIENSQMQRQTGAAVESFRNEMVEFNRMNVVLTHGSEAAEVLKLTKKAGV